MLMAQLVKFLIFLIHSIVQFLFHIPNFMCSFNAHKIFHHGNIKMLSLYLNYQKIGQKTQNTFFIKKIKCFTYNFQIY